ncbi:hypothetical protein Pint_28192 [Pistacia integerrima]|uniref:Uncharacterized protein n=1 Tax=Pistacia integerrima TaxID=434235 RepID=A0ACC0YPJ7_9ROSI|nr:hypothetical protein Pint_28192 [Pistacia integerrima]
MEWLTKIVQGPNHKGQYHGKYGDDRIWNEPRDSVDDSSDFDREEIDRAIAMSLSEVDQKGKKSDWTCAGCNIEIGHGRYLSCMGAFWHPECLHCHGCNQPITDIEFSMFGSRPYHKHCRKEQHHPKCDLCHNFVSIFPMLVL